MHGCDAAGSPAAPSRCCAASRGAFACYAQSTFTLLRGVVPPQELPALAARLGWQGIMLADRDSLAGAPAFLDAARREGMAAALGVELTDREGNAALVVVRDRAGYEAACALVSGRMLDAGFRLEQALGDAPDGVCVLAGGAALAAALAPRLAPGRLGVLLVRPSKSVSWEASQQDAARRLGLPLAAASRYVYPCAEDAETGRLLEAIAAGRLLGQVPLSGTRGRVLPPGHAAALFQDVPEACDVMQALCADTDLSWERSAPIVPLPPLRFCEPPERLLRRLAREGLRRRGPVARAAWARLDRELGQIGALDLAGYFLTVWDIVREARARGIFCTGRGSGAGSLVSYALGITAVDPLAADLLFERFLNPLRPDLPDLDLDLDWRRRDELIAYVDRRHGRERVAMIGSYVTFGNRLAFRETARALGLAPSEVNALSRRIPHERSEGGIRAALAASPRSGGTAWDRPPLDGIIARAGRLLDLPRHLGIHPAGVVIGDGPLCRRVPLARAPKGIVVTQQDMHAIEQTGLIKIDMLGNRALGELAQMRTLVAARHGVDIDLASLPRTDAATGALLARGDAVGCFQVESPGMRQLMIMLGSRTWADLVTAVALIRPGPSAAGAKDRYLRRLHGVEAADAVHAAVAPTLGARRGVLLFQEDVMRVFCEVTGRSLAEGELLRLRIKAARDDRAALAAIREAFLRQACAAGTGAAQGARIWEELLRFAAYTYNQAHAAVFGLLAWCAAYFKAHFPLEFFCAVLDNHGGMYAPGVILAEAVRAGIAVRGPSVNGPAGGFAIEGRALRMPLGMVRALSERTCERIARAQPFAGLDDVLSRVRPSSREAENLVLAGALDFSGMPRPVLLWELAVHRERRGPAGACAFPVPRYYPPLPPLTVRQKAAQELAVMAFAPSGSPLAILRAEAGCSDHVAAEALAAHQGREVRVMGLAAAFREAPLRRGGRMAFMSLQEETGWIEVVFFPREYRRLAAVLHGPGPFEVRGVVRGRFGALTLEARDAAEITTAPRHVVTAAGADDVHCGVATAGQAHGMPGVPT